MFRFYWVALTSTKTIIKLAGSILAAIGIFCSLIQLESYFREGGIGSGLGASATCIFIFISIAYILYDAFCLSGYLRRSVIISAAPGPAKITITFGNMFKYPGWKVIAVNNFFDSLVDEGVVAKKTNHGRHLLLDWKDDIGDWDKQVADTIRGECIGEVKRVGGKGKRKQYPIGTTATAQKNGHDYIEVALSATDIETNIAKAEFEDFVISIRSALARAREVCANQPLIMPVLGGTLSRLNLNTLTRLCILLSLINHESNRSLITTQIFIVVSCDDYGEVNLKEIKNAWTGRKA